MISLDKFRAARIAIVHDKCPDGYASALLIKDALPDIQVRFVQHNTPEHKELVAEPGLLFADFSPPAERVQEFVAAGALILDHHKTARAVVESFGENGAFGDEVTEPGVCGATLVYRHLWLPLSQPSMGLAPTTFAKRKRAFVERFAHLAGIRDTWQNKHSDWYESCVQAAALFFCDPEELLKEGLWNIHYNWESKYRWAGKISHDRHLKQVARAVRDGFKGVSPKGTRVILFQNTKLSSEAAEAAEDTADLVVGFDVFTENGTVVYLYSTRSHTNFDCGKFCKTLGGGGHTGAAGFTVHGPLLTPYSTFLDRLTRYEGE